MQYQRSPNRWSCLATAFAMACRTNVNVFMSLVGHDGSDIMFPDLDDPLCRRSFHIQECIWAAMDCGFRPVEHQFKPRAGVSETRSYTLDYTDRIREHMNGNCGVLLGMGVKYPHAAAWNGTEILDPSIGVYDFGNQFFRPNTFISI